MADGIFYDSERLGSLPRAWRGEKRWKRAMRIKGNIFCRPKVPFAAKNKVPRRI